MPGFDKSLDVVSFSESVDFERSVITVAIHTYNEGIPKVQVGRQSKKADGELGFAKLGRMTKEELEKVLPLLEKAKKEM